MERILKILWPFFLTAPLFFSACATQPSQPSIAEPVGAHTQLFNGYQLTGVVTRNNQGEITGRAVITYDLDNNSSDWAAYDKENTLRYNEVGYYNEDGYLYKSEYFSNKNQLQNTSVLSVDDDGKLLELNRSNGYGIKFTYNKQGLLTGLKYRDQTNGPILVEHEFKYNAQNQISNAVYAKNVYEADTLVSSADHKRFFKHNPKGQLVIRTLIEKNGDTIDEYQYDEHGNNILRIRKHPNGSVVSRWEYLYEKTKKRRVNLRLRSLHYFQ